MAFMDVMSRQRDKHIIRQAYHGQNAQNAALSDQAHVQFLKKLAKEAADGGLSIEEAYDLYDDYIAQLEATDAAFDDEVAQEGEDPALLEEDDE